MTTVPAHQPAPVPTAVQTVAAVQGGTTTARRAVQAALDRIAAVDGALGAYQVVRSDRALAEADDVDRRPDVAALPLAGLPVAVKDNVPVAGEPMRDGSAASDPAPQARDHEVVRRLRAAGAVVVGLTRVPELCVFGATDSVFGVTRNPWDPTRSPGGSSGGSAAAVASGTVAVAHGNDGMGSLRIPAACCGLVTLKPGLGTVPSDLWSGSWFDMAENGPLATTVADLALVLSAMADRPELAAVTPPPPLRVALSVRSPVVGVRVDRELADAARRTADALAGAGHRVVEADPTYPTSAAVAALSRWVAGTEVDVRLLQDRRHVERRVRTHAALGRLVLRTGLLEHSGRARWQQAAERFFADHDVLVTPALAQRPPAAEPAWGRRGWPANVAANVRYAPFCAPWNLAGWPAAAVPAGMHSTGTPLGVQLVAPAGGEQLLLQVAAQLEQLRPWPRLAPDQPR